jgi:hypothetical protein
MQRRCTVAAPWFAFTFALLMQINQARATLLVYEPFNYPNNMVLAGTTATGLNLTGGYTSTAIAPFLELLTVSPGLNYGSLTPAPAAAGNRLTQNQGTTGVTATVSVDQDIDTGAGTATFFSALFTFDDSSNGNRLAEITLEDESNADTLSFGETVAGVRAIRVSASTAALGNDFSAGADLAFSNGQTLFLIARYVNGIAAGADSLELIGYDTADAVTLPAIFNPADPNAQFSFALTGLSIDFSTISSIHFTIRGDANNFIDELRIGSTYADIVPEPASASLLLALAAALFRRRCA